MKIEELRINDIVKCKTDDKDTIRYVSSMNNRGDIELNKVNGEEWEVLDASISDIIPVEINASTLKIIGAMKNPFTNEFVILADNKEFCLKPDLNTPLWICSRLNKYRPPFVKVKFIHEIQRYLLDSYMTVLKVQ